MKCSAMRTRGAELIKRLLKRLEAASFGDLTARGSGSIANGLRLLFCLALAKKCRTRLCDVRTSVNFPKRENDYARIRDDTVASIREIVAKSEG